MVRHIFLPLIFILLAVGADAQDRNDARLESLVDPTFDEVPCLQNDNEATKPAAVEDPPSVDLPAEPINDPVVNEPPAMFRGDPNPQPRKARSTLNFNTDSPSQASAFFQYFLDLFDEMRRDNGVSQSTERLSKIAVGTALAEPDSAVPMKSKPVNALEMLK